MSHTNLVEVQVGPASRSHYWGSILSKSGPVLDSTPTDLAMEKGSREKRRAGSDSGNDSCASTTSCSGSGSGSIATSKSRSMTRSCSTATSSKSSRPFTMQSAYASPENWESHRAEITTLYLDQDKTLREVKEHMEQSYQFFATEKMYKTRIKKWALDKNNKMDEVVHMVCIRNQRAALGKETEFTVRNRKVDWKDIERYMNRTPALVAKIEDGQMELGSSALGIVCRTPSPDPARMLSVPANLNATRYLTLQEEIMTLLRDYMVGAFEKKLWLNSPADNCCYGPNGMAASYSLSHWYEGLEVAGRWEADEADTVRLINIQMDQIRDRIRDEEPSLLSCLILFHHNLSLQRTGLTHHVCPFVASMCDVVLGPQHPVTQLWGRAIQLPPAEFGLILERSAKFRYDFFSSKLEGGERNWTAVFSLCQYAQSLSPNNPSEVERITRLLIRDFNPSTSLRFQIDSQIMRKLASLNVSSGNYDTAAEILERLKEWIVYGEPFAPPYFSRLISGYNRELALLYLVTGRREEAAALLRQNYNYCVETFGPTAFRTMRVAMSMLHNNIAETPEEAAMWEFVINQGRVEHLNKQIHHTSAIVLTEPVAEPMVQGPNVSLCENSHSLLAMHPPAVRTVVGVHVDSTMVGMPAMVTSSPLSLSIDPELDLQLNLARSAGGSDPGYRSSRKSSATSAGSLYHSQDSSPSNYSTQGLEKLSITRSKQTQ